MLNMYDFEVFQHNWCVCIINPLTHLQKVIWDDVEELKRFYEEHKNEIFIGFNSRHYDQYIMKALLCGLDAWKCNEHIIIKKQPGWSFSSLMRKIFLINYDVMPLNSSLKQLEGFQGHDIYESEVDFMIDRPLTDDEKDEVTSYCFNDVEECINVFTANINDFNALMWLVKEFKFPLSYMSKTKAQISAEILECERVERDDEFDVEIVDCLQLKKYDTARQWFLDPDNHFYKDAKGNKNVFYLDVAGVRHDFGYGGIHGARKKYHYRCDSEHLMLHVDVALTKWGK